MSTNFMASNGIFIAEFPDPKRWSIDQPNRKPTQIDPFEMQALREFFRAEEDERLGRWRWPERPEYVVYPRGGVFEVLNERTLGVLTSTRDGNAPFKDEHAQAARAYFEAHPEPKPWHDAEVGDVWLLKFSGFETAEASPWTVRNGKRVDEPLEFVYPQNGNTIALDDAEIIDARRIWPEVSA